MSKEIRQKRSNAKTGASEGKYNRDFAIQSDKKLSDYLRKQGFPSLSKLLDATGQRNK